MLHGMKFAGYFNSISGITLGSFYKCGNINDIYSLVKDIFKKANFPILAGFESGHGKTNIALPMGIMASLDADKQVLSIKFDT